jgi:ABC-type transport system substrate-binding protein
MTLRPGVRFSDGSALDAAVVVANFAALRAAPLTSTALQPVQAVTAKDASTVIFTLNQPYPALAAALTTQVGYVVGQAMIDASTGSSPPQPVGTGPFVYASWQPNDHFTATRNPHYWRSGLPYLDQITFKPIPDTTQREATLRTGGVDMIISTDPNTIQHFTGSGGSGYAVVDSLNGVIGQPTIGFVMLNTEVAPTSDLSIRQALAYATDYATIQKLFDAGYGSPVNGLFPKSSPYYSDTGFPTYNLSKAKSLVSAYKAQHGTPALLLQTIPDPRYIKLVEILQQMWNQAGFNVSVGEVQQADIITDFVVGKFQAVTSYQFGAVDPALNYVWFSTTTVAPIGSIGLNFPRNSDPAIQTALQTGRSTTDSATRVSAYRTVNERLAQDLPYLWLGQFVISDVAATRVQNFASITLPDGSPGYGFDEGVTFPTQVWLAG